MRTEVKETKTEQVTRIVEYIVHCDLCGRKAEGRGWDSSTWGSGYDHKEVEIEVKIKKQEGEHYPEGSSGTEWLIDMCPECFQKKLVPWMISQGAKIEEKDYDF